MKKIKVLNRDMTTPFQNFEMEIGKKYTCKDFDPEPLRKCSRGFYATDIEGVIYSWKMNRKAFEVEVSGNQVIVDQFKQRFEHIELIREIPHEELKALAKEKEDEAGYKISGALFPFDPFSIEGKPGGKDWDNLEKWASVGASVLDSVWASVREYSVLDLVWYSVWYSVRNSVWYSVREYSVWYSVVSVRNSVGDSVLAYISSLYPNIKKWEYIDHKPGENPFQPGIDLWYNGLVPVKVDGVWKLVNKNGILSK